jgi:hypothetical protein
MDKFNALEHATAWAIKEFRPAYNEGRITWEEFVKDSLEYVDVVMRFMRDNPGSHKSYREILDLHNAGRTEHRVDSELDDDVSDWLNRR